MVHFAADITAVCGLFAADFPLFHRCYSAECQSFQGFDFLDEFSRGLDSRESPQTVIPGSAEGEARNP